MASQITNEALAESLVSPSGPCLALSDVSKSMASEAVATRSRPNLTRSVAVSLPSTLAERQPHAEALLVGAGLGTP